MALGYGLHLEPRTQVVSTEGARCLSIFQAASPGRSSIQRQAGPTTPNPLVLHSLPPLPTVQGLGSALLHGTEFSYQYIFSPSSAMGGSSIGNISLIRF